MSKPSALLQIKRLRRVMFGPVSFEVESGECLCISGPSGAGKSMLLRAIADLDPHEGEALLEGVPAPEIKPAQWRAQVGLLPPESSWWLPCARDHFSNGEPVLLEALGLPPDKLDAPIIRLSSGEKQRLALLRLLVNRPRVLLLDEPTANLDRENSARIERLIGDYRRAQGAAVIWVSHNPEQILRIANRHVVMEDGVLHEQVMERTEWLR